MSIEENKASARRCSAAIAAGDLDVIDELVAPDYIDHSALPGQGPGPEGVKFQATMLRAAFADPEMEVEDVVAEGDKVAMRQTFRGTHRAEFMGIPPTGKRVSLTMMFIVRFRDGQVIETTAVDDMLGFLQQLGALPHMGQPGREEEVRDELTRLEHAWMDAVKRQDLAACEPIMAGDFRLLPGDLSNAEGVSREQWFANARQMSIESFNFDAMQVHAYGDAAVVQSRFSWRVTGFGRELNDTLPLTDIWVRRAGRWQVTVRYSYPSGTRPNAPTESAAQAQ